MAGKELCASACTTVLPIFFSHSMLMAKGRRAKQESMNMKLTDTKVINLCANTVNVKGPYSALQAFQLKVTQPYD